MQDDSDSALMQKTAEGDRQAYRLLVERYNRRAFALARRLLGNASEAEDAVQDAFIKLWVSAKSYQPEKASVSTWFYRILGNGCIDRSRKKKTLPLDDAFELRDPSQAADEALIERQRGEYVARAVAVLPERQRLAIALCFYEGIAQAEAAAIMGLHVKALEGLLFRARNTLKNTLGQQKDRI